ncbi:MAG: GNAT family protein [bacterium]|nr:GNAT family protein [bacterium]
MDKPGSIQDWRLNTERLSIRAALPQTEDIEFFLKHWNDGRVMKLVGFPQGLRIDREQIRKQFESYGSEEFNRTLVVSLADSGVIIGECKLGLPDDEGLANTDVKLSPKFWGNAYGQEIKRALVSYLFEHTDCAGVQGTPHRDNAASIKMQESVGAKRIKEITHEFPEHTGDYTCDLNLYLYIVSREDWKAGG